MLEVRYNTKTMVVTGWWGNRHGNHAIKLKNRPDEEIVYLNIDIPDKPLPAWLVKADQSGLKSNPAYIKEEPPRNLGAEVTKIRKTLIEKGIVTAEELGMP